MKHLDGVSEAKVNFGASKLTVYGNVTIEELEKAGAFENLSLYPEKQKVLPPSKEPFWKEHAAVLGSLVFVLLGYLSQFLYGEGSLITIAAFLGAILIGGFSLFIAGFKNLASLEFDMRTLMTIAIIGAAIIGEWSEGAIVVILFAISEALEKYSMDKARNSIRSLMDIAPNEALVRRNGQDILIGVEDIEIGDIMLVKPGQKIAMDGLVANGVSAVNQAAITGESVPAEKVPGDEVFAGTLNGEGLLEVQVTKRVEDTTIAKIIHLVEEAQAERAPSQAFVDKFAKYYTPAIILAAVLVAVIPPLLFNGDWSEWIYQGLAALVVGCPCALVISTPVSIVTAIGNAARNGVLIKGGIYLEQTGAIRAVAFDKTGTLTEGIPTVTDYVYMKAEKDDSLASAVAALELRSQHPLASAIIKKAEEDGINYSQVQIEDFTSITGKGIKGRIAGVTFYVGNPRMFAEMLASGLSDKVQTLIREMQEQGKTVMVAGTEQEVLAIIAAADEVRESSREVIADLHRLGIEKTIMLTGDNRDIANAISERTGVTEVKSELLPQDKLAAVKQLKEKYGNVAMVGDGVNDAPALAAATIGIAMGGAGTDTALETADIALMGDNLKKLPFTIQLSRKTLRIIKQNITFSLGVKLLALLLVIPGWLTLWIAIFADMGATLIVTLNGLRLLRVRPDKK
ncbi:Cd2+/Zn2+-exporting ATPase [Mesobacillus foraminis]|uniref:Cd(2+)-exporting ATPase n=1 Tax=Mesobacillus foraminis TaxID=279826 RepID=A0A4R2BEZ4_9BACI|nr:Cd2+/Zn2+-exporting ATPase [Mesobacillus foraminis]